MSEQTVYDIGELDTGTPRPRRAAAPSQPTSSSRPRIAARPLTAPSVNGGSAPRGGVGLGGTLSLFVPGAGQLVTRDVATALFIMSAMGFLVAFGWALVETLDRLIATLRILGYPGAPAVWALAAVYLLAATLHLGAIVTGEPRPASSTPAPTPHPFVAGGASVMLPGWGQILNGCPRRGAMFVGALWLVGALWILASVPVLARLDSLGLYLPQWLIAASQPAVRLTAPAVIWTLAVYDAITTAASRR